MSNNISNYELFKDKMLINGLWTDSAGNDTMSVSNPANSEVIGTIPTASRGDTIKAIKTAHEAQKVWANKSAYERSEALYKLGELMLDNKEELAQIMTAECGKVINEARGEINYAVGFIKWYAEEAKRIYGENIPATTSDKRLKVIKQPVGVCGIITPWNFPSAMITRKAAPALAAGCSCVVKPSELTPYSALAIGELALRAGIPAGVLNIVTGKPSVIGDELLGNDLVKKLSFTGSTVIGRMLIRESSDTVKNISLELGGHAPFIVFEDADIDSAVEGAVACKFRNSGQTCVCANRFYIHEDIFDEFTEKFVNAVRKLKVGDGAEEDSNIGPLISKPALEKVRYHLEDALKKGAELLTGGKVSSVGELFFEPTIIKGVTHDMIIAREETFGPVAPIISFNDEKEVIKDANNTRYGLAAYFYTKDADRIIRVSESLEYGIVGVNDGIPSTPQAPFGGVKESGIGREGGHQGIEEYLETKYISQKIN